MSVAVEVNEAQSITTVCVICGQEIVGARKQQQNPSIGKEEREWLGKKVLGYEKRIKTSQQIIGRCDADFGVQSSALQGESIVTPT